MKNFSALKTILEKTFYDHLSKHPKFPDRFQPPKEIPNVLFPDKEFTGILDNVYDHIKKKGMPNPTRVSLKKLTFTQHWVNGKSQNPENEESWHEKSNLPLVVKDTTGKHYVLDGHHRLTDAYLRHVHHGDDGAYVVHLFHINKELKTLDTSP